MLLGPTLYAAALVAMLLILAAIVVGDQHEGTLARSASNQARRLRHDLQRMPMRVGFRFLATTCLVGAALFALPPTGEMPVLWEVLLAFLAWIAWCYQYGLVARRRVTLAAAEAIPSLSLSLGWAHLLVAARIAFD